LSKSCPVFFKTKEQKFVTKKIEDYEVNIQNTFLSEKEPTQKRQNSAYYG